MLNFYKNIEYTLANQFHWLPASQKPCCSGISDFSFFWISINPHNCKQRYIILRNVDRITKYYANENMKKCSLLSQVLGNTVNYICNICMYFKKHWFYKKLSFCLSFLIQVPSSNNKMYEIIIIINILNTPEMPIKW